MRRMTDDTFYTIRSESNLLYGINAKHSINFLVCAQKINNQSFMGVISNIVPVRIIITNLSNRTNIYELKREQKWTKWINDWRHSIKNNNWIVAEFKK